MQYKFRRYEIARENIQQVITDLKALIESSLEDGKAENVVTIDLNGKTDIADYMIIASGTSTRHTSFLAENLVQKIRKIEPKGVSSIEGLTEGNWVLVDTGDIIVHIFRPEVREMYNLEKMWAVPLQVEAKEVELATVN
ncbi:MAG: rsfS [Rickettsiaceae bacterium]|nr:rsfS [Rickettsiaceae bacterium]